jgi:hypothetical protein
VKRRFRFAPRRIRNTQPLVGNKIAVHDWKLCYVRFMSRRKKIFRTAGAIFLLFTACLSSHARQSRAADSGAPGVQTFPLAGPEDLEGRNMKLAAVEYKGRKAVRITMERQPPYEGLTLLRGTEFADGAIEADMAVKVNTPPGIWNPGFIGIGFRARPDARHYEMFFLRPGNSGSEDQIQRNHSVQYVSKPDFDFSKLRRPWPSVYEAYADLQPETWTRVKIEVQGRLAKLYVNSAANPVLVVDGLKGEELKGGVGLWAGPGRKAISPTCASPTRKGSPSRTAGTPTAPGRSRAQPIPEISPVC